MAADPNSTENLVEAKVADAQPVEETIEARELPKGDPDSIGTAAGLNPDPEAPLAVKEELEARDRQRLDGSSDEPR